MKQNNNCENTLTKKNASNFDKDTFSSSQSVDEEYEDSSDVDYEYENEIKRTKKTKIVKTEEEEESSKLVPIAEKIEVVVKEAMKAFPSHEIRISYRKTENNDTQNANSQVLTIVFRDKKTWEDFYKQIAHENNLKVNQNKPRDGNRRCTVIGNLLKNKKFFPPVTRCISFVCKSHLLDFKPSTNQTKENKARTTYIVRGDVKQCSISVYAREHQGNIYTVTINENEAFHTTCLQIIEPSKFPLPYQTRQRIGELLVAGFKPEVVRNMFTDDSKFMQTVNKNGESAARNFTRLDLLTLQEVNEIGEAYKVGKNLKKE